MDPRSVRPASRGLVVRDGHLLVTVHQGTTGEFWLTPGGGQDHGETKVDNVAREVLEETGYHVTVGDLACGRDYIGWHHFDWDTDFHQTELWFWCRLVADAPAVVDGPDQTQVGIRWVRMDALPGSPLYPRRLSEWLNEDPATRPIWLGDVN